MLMPTIITIAASAMEAAVTGDGEPIITIEPTHTVGIVDGNVEALQERERTLVAEIESWRDKYGPAHPMIRPTSACPSTELERERYSRLLFG